MHGFGYAVGLGDQNVAEPPIPILREFSTPGEEVI